MLKTLKYRVRSASLDFAANRLVWMLAVTGLLFLQACGSAVDELNFTRKQPSMTDIIGTWIPNQQTLDDMQKIGGYTISTHELRISSNGQFCMTNMPDWWTNGFGHSGKGFDSCGGNWKMVEDTGSLSHWVISLEVTNSAGKVDFVYAGVHLVRQKSPYLIHFYRGDPDSGNAMYFERKDVSSGDEKNDK